jgi:hypothetical protein
MITPKPLTLSSPFTAVRKVDKADVPSGFKLLNVKVWSKPYVTV